MQEVVKRMQEKQEKMKEVKLPDRVTLCIAKWREDYYPVVLPKSLFGIKSGDLIWFKLAPSGEVCGEVIFVDDYCEAEGNVWTLAALTTGMEPIKARRYAQTSDVKWEESK